LPDQLRELDAAELRRLGLQLDPDGLWSDDGGLMRAAVNLSGCSAAFVSADGLIATNHHCAHSAIQAASSVEHDYLTHGFLAKTRAEELEAKGRTVRVLRSMQDVTAQVREAMGSTAGATTGADPGERDATAARAVDLAINAIVAQCEAQEHAPRCQVASFYNGSMFRLYEYMELRDVRLVYAPPGGVGEYGGETDNWMWPRHTGDFALLRAYGTREGKPADYAADNTPYRPAQWLHVSADGVAEGDFVAVLGYPGATYRYLPAPEVARWYEQVFPTRVETYGAWLARWAELGASDPALAIKVAAKSKGLANRHKNAEGMIAGLRRLELLARRQREDTELRDWAKARGQDATTVLTELESVAALRREAFAADFLLENFAQTSDAVALAVDLVRRHREAAKPEVEREGPYMERNAQALWKTQERRLRDYDARVDTALFEDFLRREQALPEGQRFVPAGTPAPARLLRASRVTDAATFSALWNGPAAAVDASRDPVIVLARALADAVEGLEARRRRQAGALLRVGPAYFELLKGYRNGPVYPDANGTLRFSYATIRGYSPQEGLLAIPRTTLAGAVAKHTGKAPFVLPENVLAKATAARESYWADPTLEDVPLCFLASGDTTGGNSGSPVIDGRGRLVGLNFDRVWENIAGDFGYDISRSRNIVVDIRYLLWLLDDVYDAGELLTELGVAEHRERPRRALHEKPEGAPAVSRLVTQSPTPADDAGAGCACRSTPEPEIPFATLVAGALLARRRRRQPLVPVAPDALPDALDPVASPRQ
jgi:MYXO-CTERM domain-containing protein